MRICETLEVNVVIGRHDNPWGKAIGLFSEEIEKHIGNKVHKMVEPTFSTTTETERITCQVWMERFVNRLILRL